MSRKIIVTLSIILFIIIPAAQTQSQEREIGKILKFNGQVLVNERPLNQRPPGEEEMRLHTGDKIRTEEGAEVEFRLGIVRLCLKEKSEVEIKGRFRPKLHYGKIQLKHVPEGFVVSTPRENIAGKGTNFIVTTQEAGTAVDVLDGQVELRRKGEVIPIIQGYKVVVSTSDHSLRVISPKFFYNPKPFYQQLLLSVILPGTSTIYARRDIKPLTIMPDVLSMGAFIGFVISSTRREDASEASIKAYNDYKININPNKIKVFYYQHRNNVNKANKYRKLQIGFAALYGFWSVYETVSTIRDGLEYRKMAKEIRELEEELQSSKIGLEIRDDAILSKVRWNFE